MKTTNKVPLLDKIIWCSQGFVASLPWAILGYYLLYFYTDIMKISGTLAGTIMFGARMFDAFTDLMIGWCVDNFHFKWGKFRTWVRFAIPANIILWPMTWLAIDGALTLNIALAVIGYGCFGAVACTLYYIPTNAQLAALTKDETERANLVAFKGVASNAASVVAVAVFMPIVNLFGGGAKGFLFASIVLLIPYVGLLWADYIMSKKYELNEDGTWKAELEAKTEGGKRIPLMTQFKYLFTNRPAVVVVLGILMMYIVQAFRNSTAVYVFEYYFEMPEIGTAALTMMNTAAILGALVMGPAVKLLKDSNRAYILWSLLLAGDAILFWALAKGMAFEAAQASLNYGLLFWIYILGGFIQGAYYNFAYLLLPQAVDYGVWKNGVNQSGFIYSLNGFTLTAGAAVGGAIVGFVLDAIGYVEGIALTPELKSSLLAVGLVVPAVLAIAHAVIQMFYGINEKKYAQMKAEIAAREAAE